MFKCVDCGTTSQWLTICPNCGKAMLSQEVDKFRVSCDCGHVFTVDLDEYIHCPDCGETSDFKIMEITKGF